MDVAAALTLASTAASAAAGGAASAAGQSAWQSLLSLVRRVGGRRDVEADEERLTAVDPADSEQVRVLTGWLGEQARADEEFAALLRGWAERHAPALRAEHSEVHNTVSGSATVNGPVIQARDIHGGINLG
ncbi:hypothetical protein ACQEU8_26135 [Streptomyces sp. CA-250714]|uniref:hypothetical protein n=1 Tax=Streptomyces sp. CA-250714 TaxID=3240060 RepID=UPI003D91D770